MDMLTTMGGPIPILGAPQVQAQQPVAPITNLGTIQSQIDAQKRQQAMAQALLSQGYIPNSGTLGVIAQAFSAYAGTKINKRAEEKISDAMARKFEEKSKAAAADALAKDPITQRTDYLKRAGLDPASEEGRNYMLTGSLPSSQSRGPMNVGPGGAIVDPTTGKVIYQAGFAPRDTPKVSMQSVDVPDGKGGSLKMNFNPQTGEYSDPFSGKTTVKFDFPPGTPPEVIAAAKAAAVANGDMGGPQLGRAPPKNDKTQTQIQAAMRRNQSAAETSQATIDTIDRLIASPGYKELGTVYGDLSTKVPMIRTDAKDAQGQLDVLGGQIALSTMSSLKALSSAGATGFGALNQEELKLLKNSVAALQAGDLSHEQLDRNIEVIREKMAKINQASMDGVDGVETKAQPSGIDALLEKYR